MPCATVKPRMKRGSPTTHKAVQLAQTGTDKPSASSQTTLISQTAVSRQVSAPSGHTPGVAVVVGSKVKVLRPAQVESWQSSSFDLLTGLVVRDVSDTIPGQVFDELFPHGRPVIRIPVLGADAEPYGLSHLEAASRSVVRSTAQRNSFERLLRARSLISAL